MTDNISDVKKTRIELSRLATATLTMDTSAEKVQSTQKMMANAASMIMKGVPTRQNLDEEFDYAYGAIEGLRQEVAAWLTSLIQYRHALEQFHTAYNDMVG